MMARDLFPLYPIPAAQRTGGALPLYTDVLWDTDKGQAVWSGGNPVITTGREALRGWVWRAIATVRYRYDAFCWSFGCELERLVGYPYQADTKRSEAIRYVTEALTVNPYITSARVTDVSLTGSTLHLQVEYTSPYGRDVIYV